LQVACALIPSNIDGSIWGHNYMKMLFIGSMV
jgi:hypothetical protein